jgi:hypothetical protein
VINLRGLNFTTLNEDKTQMLVGGGALNADIINAAYENNRVVCKYQNPSHGDGD